MAASVQEEKLNCHELVTQMQRDPFAACNTLYQQLCRLDRACQKDKKADEGMRTLEQSLPKYQDALQNVMASCASEEAPSDGILAVSMLTQSVLAARVAKHAAQQQESGDNNLDAQQLQSGKRKNHNAAERRQQQSTVARTIARLVTTFTDYSATRFADGEGDAIIRDESSSKSTAIVTSGVVPRAFLTSLGQLMDLGAAAMCPWRNQVAKLLPILDQLLFSREEWICQKTVDCLVQLTWLALPLQKHNEDSAQQLVAVPLLEQLILDNLQQVQKLVTDALDNNTPAVNWELQSARRVELVAALLSRGSCPAAKTANQWSTYARDTDCVLRVPGRVFDISARVCRLLVLPTASKAAKQRLLTVGAAVLKLFASAVRVAGRGAVLAVADTVQAVCKDLLMVPSDVVRMEEWSAAVLTVCEVVPSLFLDRAMFKLALSSCTGHIDAVVDLPSSASSSSEEVATFASSCRVLTNVLKVGGVRIHPDEYKALLTALAKLVWTELAASPVCESQAATLAAFDLLEALCGSGAVRAPLMTGGRHVVFALLDRLSQSPPATAALASFCGRTTDVRTRAAEVWKVWAVHLAASSGGGFNSAYATRPSTSRTVDIPGPEEFAFADSNSASNIGNDNTSSNSARKRPLDTADVSSNADVNTPKRPKQSEVAQPEAEVAVAATVQDDAAEVASRSEKKDVDMAEPTPAPAPEKEKGVIAEVAETTQQEVEEAAAPPKEAEKQQEAGDGLGLGALDQKLFEGQSDDEDAMSDIPSLASDPPDDE